MVAMRILEDGWDGMGGRGWDVGGGAGGCGGGGGPIHISGTYAYLYRILKDRNRDKSSDICNIGRVEVFRFRYMYNKPRRPSHISDIDEYIRSDY